MPRLVIALDIDDVLVPTDRYLAEHLAQRFGCDDLLRIEKRQGHLVPDAVALTGRSEAEIAEAMQEYMLSSEYDLVDPLEGAGEALERLAREYTLVITTARSPEFREPTRQWVGRHFPDLISTMYFPNTYAMTEKLVHVDKIGVLREAKAKWLVDDSPSHFRETTAAGVAGVLFGDYPWNRSVESPEGVQRVRSWADAGRLLLGNAV